MTDNLRGFQQSFGRYLRDPEHTDLPTGINSERVKIYENLLFNNVKGFIDTCFPVCKKILDEKTWENLIRAFFRDWRAASPYFHDIPHEFLMYLQESLHLQDLPPWFLELAHYEWVELAVDISADVAEDVVDINAEESISENSPTQRQAVFKCNPTLQNVSYSWPVHKISPQYIPQAPQNTFLVIYRNHEMKVKFSEINPATSIMLGMLEQNTLPLKLIVDQMHSVMPNFEKQQLQAFVGQIIDQLVAQQVLQEVRGNHAGN